jgi:hypothetical protein
LPESVEHDDGAKEGEAVEAVAVDGVGNNAEIEDDGAEEGEAVEVVAVDGVGDSSDSEEPAAKKARAIHKCRVCDAVPSAGHTCCVLTKATAGRTFFGLSSNINAILKTRHCHGNALPAFGSLYIEAYF